MSICINAHKNGSDFGYIEVRDNQIYTDYAWNDCTQFVNVEQTKPFVKKLIRNGYELDITVFGGNKEQIKKNFIKLLDK